MISKKESITSCLEDSREAKIRGGFLIKMYGPSMLKHYDDRRKPYCLVATRKKTLRTAHDIRRADTDISINADKHRRDV
ncbi:hypothetical protein NECAME_04300 [Necator americanus]|uniref:Uncharacterized protein n=1 Tax=Necator americanus TaxID=51031 RepID=W2SXD9_NECAM|nr:hypothetical protein NECAME_04300 [Necator americanus]ETN73302.1 hypothetical protein NECAME_04300 [Necator americanus]